jgi:hypothetical protein
MDDIKIMWNLTIYMFSSWLILRLFVDYFKF